MASDSVQRSFSLKHFLAANHRAATLLRERLRTASPSVVPVIGPGMAPSNSLRIETFLAGLNPVIFPDNPGQRAIINDLLLARHFEEAVQMMQAENGAAFMAAWDRNYVLEAAALSDITDPGQSTPLAWLPYIFPGPAVSTIWDAFAASAWRQAGLELEMLGPRERLENIPQEGRWMLQVRGDARRAEDRIVSLDEFTAAFGGSLHINFDRPLPAFLARLCGEHPLLFLGYDFALDRNLILFQQAIQRSAGFSPQKPRHFAIVPEAATPAARFAQERLLVSMGVLPLWHPAEVGHIALSFLRYIAPEISPRQDLRQDLHPGSPDMAAVLTLSACDDPFLVPRLPLLDRAAEIRQLLDFLQDKSGSTWYERMMLVVGAPGTGKTELCRHVLRSYLESEQSWPVACINAAAEIGLHTGIMEDTLNHAGSNVVFIDDLDEIASGPETAAILASSLASRPGLKILACSHRYIEIKCRNLVISSLEPQDAVQLLHLAAASSSSGAAGSATGAALERNARELETFVQEQLGCHPAAIVQAARLLAGLPDLPALARNWPLYEDLAWSGTDPALENALAPARYVDKFAAAINHHSPEDALLAAMLLFFPGGLPADAYQEIWPRLYSSGHSPDLDVLQRGGLVTLSAQVLRLQPLAAGPLQAALNRQLLDIDRERLLAPAGAFFQECLDRLAKADCPNLLEFPHMAGIRRLFTLGQAAGKTWSGQLLGLHRRLFDVYACHIPDSLVILEIASRLEQEAASNPAATLKMLGRLLQASQPPEEARGVFMRALQMAEEDPDQALIAVILNHLGNLALRQGDAARAQVHYQEALERSLECGDANANGLVRISLACLAAWNDDPAGARALLQELLAGSGPDLSLNSGHRSRLANDPALRGRAWLMLGGLERESGSPERAQTCFLQAVNDLQAARDCSGVARCQCQLGYLQVRAGKTAAGEALCRRGCRFFEASGHLLGLAGARRCMAGISRLKGQIPDSIATMKQAQQVFGQLQHNPGLALAGADLAETQGLAGQWQEAAESMGGALEAAARSGSPAVAGYVRKVRELLDLSKLL